MQCGCCGQDDEESDNIRKRHADIGVSMDSAQLRDSLGRGAL
jgi:hypothetical protein